MLELALSVVIFVAASSIILKLMIVDEEWTLFGSANWDARSLSDVAKDKTAAEEKFKEINEA